MAAFANNLADGLLVRVQFRHVLRVVVKLPFYNVEVVRYGLHEFELVLGVEKPCMDILMKTAKCVVVEQFS